MVTTRRFAALLAALDTLDDAQLQALSARAQTILLDRPNPAQVAPPLNVEIVAAEERHLLTLYRALAPNDRRGRHPVSARRLAGRERRARLETRRGGGGAPPGRTGPGRDRRASKAPRGRGPGCRAPGGGSR